MKTPNLQQREKTIKKIISIFKKNEEIYNNKINGNITDYKNAVRKLNKIGLLYFIEYWKAHNLEESKQIIDLINILEE